MSAKADTTGLEYQSPEWFEACAAIARGMLAGKVVQYIERGNHEDGWSENTTPKWRDFFDYRLAPEPREVWVILDADGKPVAVSESPRNHGQSVKFREVIE